jgi:hypothetical protein
MAAAEALDDQSFPTADDFRGGRPADSSVGSRRTPASVFAGMSGGRLEDSGTAARRGPFRACRLRAFRLS